MDKIEKIKGMLTLLELNDDQYCYEMTSLAAKINNFLDDRSRLLSGQWISVMYVSLTEENDNEAVELISKKSIESNEHKTITSDINDVVEGDAVKYVEIDAHETTGINASETVETDTYAVSDEVRPAIYDDRFALV
jgi:translation elongation factor EF-4